VFIGGALYEKQGFLQSTLHAGLFRLERIFFLVGNSTHQVLLVKIKQKDFANCMTNIKKPAFLPANRGTEKHRSRVIAPLRII